MLPDFPETKRLFARFFNAYMRRKVREVSPFGMIRSHYIHEGRAMRVTRADQSESKSNLEVLSSPMEIRFDELEGMTLEKTIEKCDALSVDMARKQAEFVRAHLSRELPESQAVDAKGKKLDAELMIETLEKMQIEFYPDGTPHEIHLDGPAFDPERMAAVTKEFEEKPELGKKFNDLMERKRDEWRAREADRKLVG
jgi:hypothetical protein